MATVKSVLLSLKLHVEVTVLFLSICEHTLVVINLIPETGDESKVAFNARTVVLIETPLLII